MSLMLERGAIASSTLLAGMDRAYLRSLEHYRASL
jgi:hypothetical protein